MREKKKKHLEYLCNHITPWQPPKTPLQLHSTIIKKHI